jgi:transposase InsO family protein
MLWVFKTKHGRESWMDLHQNARSCPASRALLVERVNAAGWSVQEAAEAQGLSARSAYRWLRRYRELGDAGLEDRLSTPHRIPRRLGKEKQEQIEVLRGARLSGAEIANRLQLPRSTVSRWLRRMGLGRLPQLAPPEPIRRYERSRPGELVHLDIKKLGRIQGVGHRITGERRHRSRGIGWEFVHVAIDDRSRLAFAEILEDERATTAATFLQRAVQWFAQQRVRVERILSDNGSCYVAHSFAESCQQLGIQHKRTKPYRPRTNGKAERFIQTLQREWAYAFAFKTSAERSELLPRYLHFYNHHRAHSALGAKPPISRLSLNNAVRINS